MISTPAIDEISISEIDEPQNKSNFYFSYHFLMQSFFKGPFRQKSFPVKILKNKNILKYIRIFFKLSVLLGCCYKTPL